MDKTLKKITLCTLALIAVGAAKVNAATETYDFTTLNGNPINQDSEHYATGTTLYLLAVTDNNFNNRFAIGPNSRTGTAGFYFRNAGATYKGLYSQYADRNFSILNLVKGNRVTLTLSNNVETLKFVGGDAVVSGTTYTVAANGNLDFVTTGSVYIEKVVIEDPVPSVPVTVGVVGYSNTYDFTNEANNKGLINVASGLGDNIPYLLNTTDKTFDNKFAVGPSSRTVTESSEFIFKNYNTEKGFKIGYDNRNFSILDLKAGETLTITFTGGGLKITGTSILSGLSANDSPVSGTQYTVTANGRVDLTTTANNTYIQNVNISKAEQNIGGATLVSENALDFTDVDDIKAYVATDANAGIVTFTRVYKVPANTPLYLTAESAVSVEVPVLNGDAETIGTNLLKGSATNTTSLQSTGDNKFYVFGVLNDEAGFYPVSTSKTLTSAAGKAYLQLTAAPAAAAAARISMVFNDGSETTGITNAEESTQAEDNAWYTLQGVRVAQPTRGIYVRNGKKIIIK